MQFSVVNYKKVIEESHSFRIDADFFRPDYLSTQETLIKKKHRKLADCKVKIKHPTEIKREYVDDGVLFLRAQNVRPLQIDIENNPVFISKNDAELLRNNQINKKNILLTRTGANFGQCTIYLANQKAIASSHTFIINSGELNPFFLAVFLNTIYGRKLINKGMYGGLQPEIAPFFLYQIPLPIFNTIPSLIENIYRLSQEYITSSKNFYLQSQRILLSELGLSNWKPKHVLSYIKNLSNTIEAGRIDAEYFQPKYDEIVDAVKNYSGGWDIIRGQFKINKSTFQKIRNKQYNYLEISGVNISNGDIECQTLCGSELPANAKIKLKKGDLVISKVRTYRGAVALINKDDIIGSGAFTALREQGKLKKETLFTLLKSLPFLEYSLKFNTGTSYPTLTNDDILSYPVPLFSDEIQNNVKQKINQSIDFRKKSKSLLEIAKKGVEIAIEENEELAGKWINEEVGKLEIQLDL